MVGCLYDVVAVSMSNGVEVVIRFVLAGLLGDGGCVLTVKEPVKC